MAVHSHYRIKRRSADLTTHKREKKKPFNNHNLAERGKECGEKVRKRSRVRMGGGEDCRDLCRIEEKKRERLDTNLLGGTQSRGMSGIAEHLKRLVILHTIMRKKKEKVTCLREVKKKMGMRLT